MKQQDIFEYAAQGCYAENLFHAVKMKRVLSILMFIMFLAVLSYAEEIPCVAGNCGGWSISYNGNTGDSSMRFRFDNNSGEDAFSITAVINFYDYMDKYLGRITKKDAGPIHKFIIFEGRPPKDAFKMTGELYHKNEY
jgi:hypothetical protein